VDNRRQPNDIKTIRLVLYLNVKLGGKSWLTDIKVCEHTSKKRIKTRTQSSFELIAELPKVLNLRKLNPKVKHQGQ
jgi:hypothetical protein